MKDSELNLSVIEFWAISKLQNDYDLGKWKLSKKQIKTVNLLLEGLRSITELDELHVYKYGLNLLSSNKLNILTTGIDTKERIMDIYNKLSIKSKRDLLVDCYDIIELGFSKKTIGKILSEVEELVLIGKLEDKKKEIINYIRSTYKGLKYMK